jgi:hypothetical protein
MALASEAAKNVPETAVSRKAKIVMDGRYAVSLNNQYGQRSMAERPTVRHDDKAASRLLATADTV